jgi:hypothetical protein
MNIILLTQNDPYYMSKAIQIFINKINKSHKIIKTIVFEPSQFFYFF